MRKQNDCFRNKFSTSFFKKIHIKSSGPNCSIWDVHLVCIFNTWSLVGSAGTFPDQRGVSLHSPTFYIVQSQFLHLKVVKSFDKNKSDVRHGPPRCQGAHLSGLCIIYSTSLRGAICSRMSWAWLRSCEPVKVFCLFKKINHGPLSVRPFSKKKPQPDKLVHLQKMSLDPRIR